MTAQSNITITGTASGNGKFNSSAQGGGGGGILIGSANFTDGQLVPASIYPSTSWGSGSASGGSISISAGQFKASVPTATGNSYTWLEYFFPPNTLDVYVELDTRLSVGQWCKFIKFFGINLEGEEATYGYANTTYGLLAGGVLPAISFGDGAILTNDAQNVIYLDGTYPQYSGRSYGSTAVISTPQNANYTGIAGGAMRHIKIHQKFNTGTTSGNEIANGAFYLEIDGVVYANCTGLFNRNPNNKSLDRVAFGGYAQDGTAPFDMYFDNIKISTGGFV